jgi:hypothetical protein
MSAMAKGIAHVSFAGGGLFLPARSPYDRQVLAEHVRERVRANGRVQVLMGEHLWMMHRNRGTTTYCARCGVAAGIACHFSGSGEACYCVACALEEGVDRAPLPRAAERRVG